MTIGAVVAGSRHFPTPRVLNCAVELLRSCHAFWDGAATTSLIFSIEFSPGLRPTYTTALRCSKLFTWIELRMHRARTHARLSPGPMAARVARRAVPASRPLTKCFNQTGCPAPGHWRAGGPGALSAHRFSPKRLEGRSFRGGAVTLSAQGARFVLQTVSTLLLARLLAPAEFGLLRW